MIINFIRKILGRCSVCGRYFKFPKIKYLGTALGEDDCYCELCEKCREEISN